MVLGTRCYNPAMFRATGILPFKETEILEYLMDERRLSLHRSAAKSRLRLIAISIKDVLKEMDKDKTFLPSPEGLKDIEDALISIVTGVARASPPVRPGVTAPAAGWPLGEVGAQDDLLPSGGLPFPDQDGASR